MHQMSMLLCFVLRIVSKGKRKYRNTVNNLISPNTVSQNDEKPHTAELDGTALPHVKIKMSPSSCLGLVRIFYLSQDKISLSKELQVYGIKHFKPSVRNY